MIGTQWLCKTKEYFTCKLSYLKLNACTEDYYSRCKSLFGDGHSAPPRATIWYGASNCGTSEASSPTLWQIYVQRGIAKSEKREDKSLCLIVTLSNYNLGLLGKHKSFWDHSVYLPTPHHHLSTDGKHIVQTNSREEEEEEVGGSVVGKRWYKTWILPVPCNHCHVFEIYEKWLLMLVNSKSLWVHDMTRSDYELNNHVVLKSLEIKDPDTFWQIIPLTHACLHIRTLNETLVIEMAHRLCVFDLPSFEYLIKTGVWPCLVPSNNEDAQLLMVSDYSMMVCKHIPVYNARDERLYPQISSDYTSFKSLTLDECYKCKNPHCNAEAFTKIVKYANTQRVSVSEAWGVNKTKEYNKNKNKK